MVAGQEFLAGRIIFIIVGSRAQFLRLFSGQHVLMIDLTSWGNLLKI